jgi:hypothetical protein
VSNGAETCTFFQTSTDGDGCKLTLNGSGTGTLDSSKNGSIAGTFTLTASGCTKIVEGLTAATTQTTTLVSATATTVVTAPIKAGTLDLSSFELVGSTTFSYDQGADTTCQFDLSFGYDGSGNSVKTGTMCGVKLISF